MDRIKKAVRESWGTKPMPQNPGELDYSAEFSDEQMELLSLGLIPEEMEDHWFIFLEGSTLHLHRSWTGFCIYQVEFAKVGDRHRVERALVNRDRSQYRTSFAVDDVKLLGTLLDGLARRR